MSVVKLVAGGLALVIGGFAGGFVMCGATAGAQPAPAPASVVRVAEDGSGVLPAGTFNSVLGDLSGRGFCINGELCND